MSLDLTSGTPQSITPAPEIEVLPDDSPRPLRKLSRDEVLAVVGSAVGSFALVHLVYYEILPFTGGLGFLVCWYFAFLLLYAGVTAVEHPRPVVVNRLMGASVTLVALTVTVAVASVIIYTVARGWGAFHHLNFFTQNGGNIKSTSPLNVGGIKEAIVGSFIQVGMAVIVSLPLGVATAVFMTEMGGWFSRAVRTVIEAMTAVPDLLAGLFVLQTLILAWHGQKDGLAVAIALSITMTPIVARTSEVALRVVPGGLREASLALGSSHWATVRRVVLPTALPGLTTALILAVARGVGESAPLLIVSGFNQFWNKSPFNNTMNSLPLTIYTYVRDGAPLLIDRAYGAAMVLLIVVVLLFTAVRLLNRQRVTR
jgi:phosphate transport system permease protein